MQLNTENARAFNSSLKAAIKTYTGQNVKISIVNSYKFPDCWVQVRAETEFTNEFRLQVFDACGFKRESLLHPDNVSFGNIRSNHISAYVSRWEKLFSSLLTQ